MDAQLAKAYREQWQAVAAREAEEQRTASLEVRWRQLNAILRLAMGLRLPLGDTDRQEQDVRERWAKLKGLAA